MVGMKERSLGFGERMDLSEPANDNPGAQYGIGGFCEKFRRMKKKDNCLGG
jgi:hypothetical protein